MAGNILLLGHDRTTGLELARFLLGMGFQPLADNWNTLVPRAYGRSRRPDLVLADVDSSAATPLADFIPWARRHWGEHLPVIAVTVSGRFRDMSALIDAGAVDCLMRSAPAALVERKIRRCLPKTFPPATPDQEVPEDIFRLFHHNPHLVRLRDIADVHSGAAPRQAWGRRMASPGEGWRGVVTAGSLERFSVGSAREYLSWNRLHLFRLPAPSEYDVPEKVFVSRSGPPLVAAVDRSRLPAGNDIYSVVPRDGAGAGYIACLLNSRLMDFYFNRLAGETGGRLRPETLREAPVPRPTVRTVRQCAGLAALLTHYGVNPRDWIDRQSMTETWERMEELVFSLFGAGDREKASLAVMHF